MLQPDFWTRKTRGRRRRLPLVSRMMAGAGAGLIAGSLLSGLLPPDGTKAVSRLGSPPLLAGALLLYLSLWIGLARRPGPVRLK